MATRDGSGGQQHKTSKRADEAVETTELRTDAEAKERKEQLDDEVDSMLDEIDEVLEENSEDFVRSFVQKGGE